MLYYLLTGVICFILGLLIGNHRGFWNGYEVGNDEWRKRQPVSERDELERIAQL